MNKVEIVTLLSEKLPVSQIYIDEPMKKYTSFKIGGNAEILVKIRKIKELEHVIHVAAENNVYITVIGNGSNILVKDNGIQGIVAKLELNKIEIEPTSENEYILKVGAGVKLGELAQRLLKEELTGFEFAAGIPGTIGGAIKMNAGAYGKEMKDLVIQTKCLNLEKYKRIFKRTNIDDIEIVKETGISKIPEFIILNNEEQKFSYRNSIFMKKKYIVLETKLRLHKGNKEEIKAKMEEYSQNRKAKQPIQMPSAGSTFKRGKDYITAQLIDECGLKGYTIGGAQVSNLHAGFIVNTGKATAEDVIKLIGHIKKVVYEKTGKEIELEIEILGD